MDSISVDITNAKTANEAVLMVQQYCVNLGFGQLNTNLIISAASEIVTNVVKYGESGCCEISSLNKGCGIQLKISDRGKGIENIDDAIQDGFSTQPSSLGIGLGVAKRAMDYFHIESKVDCGTTVTMEKWLPVPASLIEYAAISVPDSHYMYNGDGYLFKEFKGNSVFVGIIDSLGEGYNAWQTTEKVKVLLSEDYMLDVELLMRKCESVIVKHNRETGAAIGLLRITPEKISIVGIGDVFVKIYSEEKINFFPQSGIVGAFTMPKLKKKEITLSDDTTIILCTDGIHDWISRADLPLLQPPKEIAKCIYSNYRRSNGDATVLVIKIKV